MVEWSFPAVHEVEALYGGTNAGGGDYAKKCQDNDGTIKGIGPQCNREEEAGKRELFECYYNRALECGVIYQTTIYGCWRYAGNCGTNIGYYIQSDCDDSAGAIINACTNTLDACTSAAYNAHVECNIACGINNPDCNEACGVTRAGADAACFAAFEPCQESGNAVHDACDDDPTQRCDTNAQLEHDACIDRIANQCECKQCEKGTSGGGDDDDDDITNPPPTTEPPAPPDPNVPAIVQLRSNSAYTVIPRVFGRYVVAGNVLWLGNEVEEEVTFTQVNGDEAVTFTDTVKKVDFLVGLCVGPMTGVLRIWMNDVLIFNDTLELDEDGVPILTSNNGSTELDAAAFADSEYNLARLAAYKPTIEFLGGSDAQRAQANIASVEGFGRVPASRGICCVMFRDVDVNLFNATTFPKFRFEVFSTTADQTDPVVENITENTLDTTAIAVDQRTRLVYAMDANEVKLFDLDTLALQYTADITSDPINVMKTGYVWDNGNIIDPFRNEVRTSAITMLPAPYSDGMIYFDEFSTPYELSLVGDALTNQITMVSFNYGDETASVLGTLNDSMAYAVDKAIVAELEGHVCYVQFAVDGDNLVVLRYDLLDTSNVLLDPYEFTSYTVAVDGIIGETIIGLVRDVSDNSFVVMFSNGTIVKVESENFTVEWETVGPVLTLPGDITTVTAEVLYYFVDASDSTVYLLTLASGEVTTYDGLEEPIVGAQYYDSRTRSILYITDDGLRRVFLGRTFANRVAFSEILDTLAEQIGAKHIFNTDAVDDVFLDGFMIDYKTNLAEVFNQMMELYQVAVVDDGTSLTVVDRASYTDLVAVDQDTDVEANSLRTERLAPNSIVNTVTANFVAIDDTGLIEDTQSATLNPEYEEDEINELSFSFKLLDNATSIREHLEKVLVNRRSSSSTAEATLLSRMLSIIPQDRITLNGQTYRVGMVSVSPDFGVHVSGAVYDKANMDVTVTLDAAQLSTGSELVRPTKHPVYRPVALFMPSPNNEDVTRALSGFQPVLTGINAPTREIDSTNFSIRITGSPIYNTPSHTEAMHSGYLTTPPAPFNPQQFATDNNSVMVIAFDHIETVDFLTTNTLLIVGREYIRFGAFNHTGAGVVEFTELSRGQYNTDEYMREHVAGEHAYLYTPESIKVTTVDPTYTAQQAMAKVFYKRPLPAGVTNLTYAVRTDAGSLRPSAPGDVRRFRFEDDDFVAYIDWQHRRAYETNNIDNCGALNNDYTYVAFQGDTLAPTQPVYTVYFLADGSADLAAFEERIVRTGDAVSAADPYFLEGFSDNEPNILTSLGIDPLVDWLHLVVFQQATDPTGEVVFIGHPTFVSFPPGEYPNAVGVTP
jgi:hypothetical protein